MARASKQPRQRYAKVARALWSDETFLTWSAPERPSAQWLWLFLLTTPLAGSIPGVLSFSVAETAERFGWETEATRSCLAEIVASGRAEYDAVARLLYLPNGLRWNEPESPNVVRGWARQWTELAECALKKRISVAFRRHLAGMSPPFTEAFDALFPERRGKASPKDSQTFPESVAGAETGAETGAGAEEQRPPPSPPPIDALVEVFAGCEPLRAMERPERLATTARGLAMNVGATDAVLLEAAREACAKFLIATTSGPKSTGYFGGILRRLLVPGALRKVREEQAKAEGKPEPFAKHSQAAIDAQVRDRLAQEAEEERFAADLAAQRKAGTNR